MITALLLAQLEGLFNGGDWLEVRRVTEHHYEIEYGNNGSETSKTGNSTVTVDGMTIGYSVTVGGADVGGAEIIHITAPDGWVAIPADANVPDGQTLTIDLLPAMF